MRTSSVAICCSAVVVMMMAIVGLAEAGMEFPVYRMFQAERVADGTTASKHGSARPSAAVDGLLTSWVAATKILDTAGPALTASNATGGPAPLAKRVVVVHLDPESVTADTLAKACSAGVSGLLLVIPTTMAATTEFSALERALINTELACTAFVAFEADVPAAVLAADSNTALSLTAAGVKPHSALDAAVLTNLYGSLSGKDSVEVSSKGLANPTIAVIAHYDSLALSPALATAAHHSGSSVAVLLEVMRVMSRVYNSPGARPRHNLAFVLASGAPLNYAGLRHWLDKLSVETSIEFALCLEDLTTSTPDSLNNMYLHISKPPKDAEVKRLYDAVSGAGSAIGVNVTVVQKKVRLASEASWPHELLAIKRMLGATLSSLPTAPALPQLSRHGSVVDRTPATPTTLSRIVELVAQALTTMVFPEARPQRLFNSAFPVDERFLESWTQTLATTPRQIPVARDAPIVQAMRQAMSSCSAAETTESAWSYAVVPANSASKNKKMATVQDDEDEDEDEETQLTREQHQAHVRFFGGAANLATAVMIDAHVHTSAFMDLFVAVGVILYLATLWVVLVGPTEAMTQTKAIVSSIRNGPVRSPYARKLKTK